MLSFTPIDGANAIIPATTGPARTAILKQPSGAHQLRLFNNGASAVRYKIGGAGVTATIADPALPAGAVEVITVQNAAASPQGFVAALCDSGSSSLEITPGFGL